MSENKPVGSTESRNLLGDEPVTSVNGSSTSSAPNDQQLIAEIFGSSGGSSTPSTSASPQPTSQRTTIDDILGLFGPSNGTTTSTPAVPSISPSLVSTPSLFDSPASPPPQAPVPHPQPAASHLTSYTAYDRNELKITLTPQTSPTRPGVVLILARFQVTGGNAVTGLTFQAAVPKVSLSSQGHHRGMLTFFRHPSVTTVANATNVKSTRESRFNRDSANARDISTWCRLNSRKVNSYFDADQLQKANVRLRLRISYTLTGRAVQDQVDFSGFPPGLTGGS